MLGRAASLSESVNRPRPAASSRLRYSATWIAMSLTSRVFQSRSGLPHIGRIASLDTVHRPGHVRTLVEHNAGVEPRTNDKLGASRSVIDGDPWEWPLHGLRHVP